MAETTSIRVFDYHEQEDAFLPTSRMNQIRGCAERPTGDNATMGFHSFSDHVAVRNRSH